MQGAEGKCADYLPKRATGPLSRRCQNCNGHVDNHKKSTNDRSLFAGKRPASMRQPGPKSATYMFPPTKEKRVSQDVVFVNGASMPCRMVMYLIKVFHLPVDLCGTDFSKHLFSEDALELNPIHSLPWMTHYTPDGKTRSINGSESIVHFLLTKFSSHFPDTFWPSDPFKQADIMHKYHYVNNTVYRATMYQYVYPLAGYLTSCQYDICKTKSAMETVEAWCQQGKYSHGEEITPVDFILVALHTGNNWTQTVKGLPWQQNQALERYTEFKRVVDLVMKEKGIQEVHDLSFKEGDTTICSLNTWNEHPEFWMQRKTLPEGRKFVRGDDVPHYMSVAYGDEQTKARIDLSSG